MVKILVLYHSKSGNTGKLAEACTGMPDASIKSNAAKLGKRVATPSPETLRVRG